MKTFASKEKRSAPAVRKARPYVHHPMGPVQQAQQAEVRHILRSTGAQARLTIGQPDDKYEQEADRVADQVMRMPDPKLQRQPENEEEEEMLQAKPLADQITSLIQRQAEPEEEEEEMLQPGYDQEPEELTPFLESVPTRDAGELGGEEEELIQPKSDTGAAPQVTSGIARDIQSIKGTGQPLPASERAFFEPRFGTDFSNVRVHTDNHAVRTAQSINARAFTLGPDVVFGVGQYSPGTHSGRKLLAHELTHVVQQSGTRKKGSTAGKISNPEFAVIRMRGADLNFVSFPTFQIMQSSSELGAEIIKQAKIRINNPLLKGLYNNPYKYNGMIVSSNKWKNRRTREELEGAAVVMGDRKSSYAKKVRRLAKRGNRDARNILYNWYRYLKIRKFDKNLSYFPKGDSYIDYNKNSCNIFIFDAIWNAGKHFFNPNGHYPGPKQVFRGSVPGLKRISRGKVQKGDIFAKSWHVGLVDYKINRFRFKSTEWFGNFNPPVRFYKDWWFYRVK